MEDWDMKVSVTFSQRVGQGERTSRLMEYIEVESFEVMMSCMQEIKKIHANAIIDPEKRTILIYDPIY